MKLGGIIVNCISIKEKIKIKLQNKKWRKRNEHNYTEICNRFDFDLVNVGKYTYGDLNIIHFGTKSSKLKIGNYCSIASEVKFILGGEHNYKNLSTYPFKKKFINEEETLTKGDIIVGDDVWIGYGAVILSGVKIGQGAVIGAGSIVRKDVPPYAVYVNDKVVKYRFNENIIKKLLLLDYSKLEKENIENNINKLYENVNEENVDEILRKIKGEKIEK